MLIVWEEFTFQTNTIEKATVSTNVLTGVGHR